MTAAAITATLAAAPAWAGPISLAAGDYTQDFDTLTTSSTVADWVDDDAAVAATGYSLVGWYHATSGSAGPYSFRASNGDTNTSRLYSHGSGTDTDRALGGINNISGVGIIWFGARFVNDTAETITGFTVTYDGEQWRDNASASADDLLVQYAIFDAGAGSISASGYTTLAEATFSSPSNNAFAGVATAIDGNDPANRVADLTATRGITLLPGQELWVRFEDALHVGDDHALDVDNFRLSTVVPEPAAGLLLLAAAPLCFRRRATAVNPILHR